MRKLRRGFTLVELLAVITVVAVILSALGVTFHVTSESIKNLQTAAHRDGQLDRLAVQLRTDLHQAVSAEVDEGDPASTPGPDGLRIELADEQSIHYFVSEGGLSRVARQGEAVQHRELFRVPGISATQWSIDRQRATPLVSLIITRRAGDVAVYAAIQEIRILAAMRLFRSFEQSIMQEGAR